MSATEDYLHKVLDRPCVSTEDLPNAEKNIIVDALKSVFPLKALLAHMGLKRSTYYHAKAVFAKPDRHADLRVLINDIFAANQARYGYRRI